MRLRTSVKSVRITQIACVISALLLPLNVSHAASCSALKSELRKLERASGAGAPAQQKWSRAKRQQQKAISAAARDARQLGCSSNRSAKCRDLKGKIKRMNANLAAIERQLANSGGGTSLKDSRRIRQVRKALETRNCDAPARTRQARTEHASQPDSQRSFFARLFNQEARPEQTAATPDGWGNAPVLSNRYTEGNRLPIPEGGAFRTLCVRTCDGYFFPVSFSTGRSQFANDEARCTEICPAASTELYFYRNPGGDRSEMMSLTGIPYSEQPFAFRYKSEFVEGCSCRLAKKQKLRSSWSEIGASPQDRVFFADISAGLPRGIPKTSRGATFEQEGPDAPPLSRLPLSKAQLPLYEDPGTLFNLEKGFDVTKLHAYAQKMAKAASEDTGSDTRPNDGFPLLTLRRPGTEDATQAAAVTPVFKTDDDGFRPAPDRDAPVRVVGPEYFVAQ